MPRKEEAAAIATQLEFSASEVSKQIYTLRGRQIMLDHDLARIYEVETKTLKRAVRRNLERFPEDFLVLPTKQELETLRCQIGASNVDNFSEADAKPNLRSNIGTSNSEDEVDGRGGTRYTPFAFSELGVAMLSSVLHSPKAIQVNIGIMRIFVQLRNEPRTQQLELAPKLESLENMLKQRLDRIEAQFKAPVLETPIQAKKTPVDIIQSAVAQHFGVTTEDLRSSLRTQTISLPRHIAIYLVRKLLCMGFSEIGKHFGGRDHTTALHAYRKIHSASEANNMIRKTLDSLQSEIQPQLS